MRSRPHRPRPHPNLPARQLSYRMITKQLMKIAALSAALTITLPAQTSAKPNSNRFVPANSAFVMRMASPAKMRQQFSQTQMAKLGETESLAPMMDMMSQQLDMTMDMMRDSGMFDADLADGLLNTWMGDIVFAAQVDWDDMMDAMEYGETPPISFVVSLTSDGSFDLSAVASEFESLVENTTPEGTLTDMPVGDWTMRRTNNGEKFEGLDQLDATLPMMIDGHLVMIGSSRLEKDAPKLLAKDARFAFDGDAPLFVHADVGRMMSSMMDVDAAGMPFDPAAILDMIGLSAIQNVTMTLRPDGKALAGDVSIGMTEDGRGIFDMMSKGNQPPKLLNAVPAQSEAFAVSSTDMKVLYTTISEIWSLFEEMVPMTFDEAMDEFAAMTKIRLKEDLFDNLGGEMMIVQDIDALKEVDLDEIADNPLAAYTGGVYGLSLSDGAKFEAALDTMIRSRGMHVGRKTESYANAKIYRMAIAGLIDVEYSINNNLLLISIGGAESASRIIRDIIDTRANSESQRPEILTKLANKLPENWNSISVMNIGTTLDGVMTTLQMAMEANPDMSDMSEIMGDEIDMMTGMVRSIIADMNRLGLSSIVQASSCDDTGLHLKMRW